MARSGTQIRELMTLAEQGKFELPEPVTAAYETFVKVQQLTLEDLNVADHEVGAHQVVVAVGRGEPVSLLDVGRMIEAGNTDRAAHSHAQRVLSEAREMAAHQAEQLVSDSVESIIERVLRPKFTEVLAEATELAARLKGASFIRDDSVDWVAMMGETDQIRNARSAWRRMEPLEAQRRAIVQARFRLDTIGNRAPQKDVDGYFVQLAHPERLQQPGWEPGKPWQRPAPSEKTQATPVLGLLWWATDAAVGVPWLPSCADQDERYEQVFGEWKRQREQQAAAGRWPTIIAN